MKTELPRVFLLFDIISVCWIFKPKTNQDMSDWESDMRGKVLEKKKLIENLEQLMKIFKENKISYETKSINFSILSCCCCASYFAEKSLDNIDKIITHHDSSISGGYYFCKDAKCQKVFTEMKRIFDMVLKNVGIALSVKRDKGFMSQWNLIIQNGMLCICNTGILLQIKVGESQIFKKGTLYKWVLLEKLLQWNKSDTQSDIETVENGLLTKKELVTTLQSFVELCEKNNISHKNFESCGPFIGYGSMDHTWFCHMCSKKHLIGDNVNMIMHHLDRFTNFGYYFCKEGKCHEVYLEFKQFTDIILKNRHIQLNVKRRSGLSEAWYIALVNDRLCIADVKDDIMIKMGEDMYLDTTTANKWVKLKELIEWNKES